MSWCLSSFNWLVIVGFHGKKKACDSTNTESTLRLEDVTGFAKHIWFLENFQLAFFFFFFKRKRGRREGKNNMRQT